MKDNFYLITGVPGAGKSLVAKELQKSIKDAIIVSTDLLREQIAELENLNFIQREDILVDLTKIVLQHALESSVPVIFDDSLYTLTPTSRGVWYTFAKEWQREITIVEVTHPKAKERSRLDAKGWDEIAARYQFPSSAETTHFEHIHINGDSIEETITFEQQAACRSVA